MGKKVTWKHWEIAEKIFMRERKKKRWKERNEITETLLLERKNFPHIILKYVLCGGRVEIVAPYP